MTCKYCIYTEYKGTNNILKINLIIKYLINADKQDLNDY